MFWILLAGVGGFIVGAAGVYYICKRGHINPKPKPTAHWQGRK